MQVCMVTVGKLQKDGRGHDQANIFFIPLCSAPPTILLLGLSFQESFFFIHLFKFGTKIRKGSSQSFLPAPPLAVAFALVCDSEESPSTAGFFIDPLLLGRKYQQAGRSDPNVNLTGGNLHLVTTMEIWEEKLSEAEKCRKSVIANFSATWCGPCRTISAFYAELAQKHPSLMFLLVDVDQLTELSTLWDIQATPTFFLLRNGQQIDKHVGANKQDLQRKITAILNSKP
ncbi:hypothetical protein CRG98_039699 [Punica granatum]|uniref:Thioredoxin domain-containing protein n=1 Tax=Punica granatum TaxID=22663 RepID=A0A2I0I8C6_PUNGR|nr:hypothetical protein CRG98_039699 [Punica granatum]